MRGVLAVSVMLYHLGLNTIVSQLTHGALRGGLWTLSVDFFFLLSGFVLARSFQSRPPSTAAYLIKRLSRLYPLFIASTVAVFCLSPARPWSAVAVGLNVPALQSLFGVSSINFPAWSIPFEIVLPLVGLPAVGWLGRRPRMLWAALVAALALSTLASGLMAGGRDIPWLRAIGGIAGGGGLYLIWVRRPHPSTSLKAPLIALFALATAMAIMALGETIPHLALLFPAVACTAIWFGAEGRGLLSTPVFQALGRWSYSIYLLHIPVLLAAQRLLGDAHVTGSPAIKLGIVLTCIAAAAATYQWLERPFIALGQRLAARRASTAP